MAGESWHKRSVDYKDSKQPDIEEPKMKHVKKKIKKSKRSKHKHEYIPALYKQSDHIMCGSHCKHCGRVKSLYIFWNYSQEKIERFKKEYPDYIKIVLPDDWDYFKNKNIPIENSKLGYAFTW